ncbi:hypothetical protein ACCT14_04820 [Rhizobium brockwellii]|uniref:hypothetical protein n=1 Tax=Rhizobium brockwellii TaxID=3019932 RepID=UPI003F9B6973
MSENMIELRKTISAVMKEKAKDGGASNDDVIALLRRTHSSLIRATRDDLENVALRKVINEVAAKKSKVRTADNLDLFDDAPKLGQLISIKVGGTVKRVPREDVDLRFLIAKYEQAIASKATNKDDAGMLNALLEMAKRVGTQDISFGEAMKKLSPAV